MFLLSYKCQHSVFSRGSMGGSVAFDHVISLSYSIALIMHIVNGCVVLTLTFANIIIQQYLIMIQLRHINCNFVHHVLG